MLDILLTILCFLGFVYAATTWLKIKSSYSPFFCISFIGVCLYFFAISGYLKTGACLLMTSGGVLSLLFLKDIWGKTRQEKGIPSLKFLFFFMALLVVALLLAHNMAFTVIDDYVYWGIIGKYLYLHDHLPVTGNPLDTRILAYTPGTALIHYFFYILPGKYSSDISYFAQSFILISALFVVVKNDNFKKSIAYMGVLIILLTIFFGSVFTKLQVDYLLSIYSFSIFWIYYNEENIYRRLLTISMPVCFLFLIKQIGFAIGSAVLIIIFLDLLFVHYTDKKDKIKAIGILFLIAGAMFSIKQLWASHITAMGFIEFHNSINMESIKRAIDIFNNEQVRNGLIIFIKEVFLGPADRLNIPYAVWYAAMIFLGYIILNTKTREKKPRLYLFFGLVSIFVILYLFMLYCLQIIIFGVGSAADYTMGFSRYFNILFSTIVFISAITFFHTILLKTRQLNKKISISVIVMVTVVLFISRLEVYLHREKQDIEVESISKQVAAQINDGNYSIGIITDKNYNLPNLQFLYYLLPNRTDYQVRKFKKKNSMIQYMAKHDYVLLYYPKPVIYEWIRPLFENPENLSEISLLKISKGKLNTAENEFALEKVLLQKEILNE